MRVDFINDPELVGRYAVIDVATGEELEHVAWADDEADAYALFVIRPRKLDDPPDVDRRVRNADGSFVLSERNAEIEIIDALESPLKAEFLALLDDPEVAEKIARIIAARFALHGPVVDRKSVAREVERVLGQMVKA